MRWGETGSRACGTACQRRGPAPTAPAARPRGAHLPAATRLLVLGLVPASTEIHYAFDAGRGGCSSATFCQLAIAISEVACAERVHEVVGDLASGQRVAKSSFGADVDRACFRARELRRVSRDHDDIVSCFG